MTVAYHSHPSERVQEAADLITDDVYVLPASVAQQRFWLLDQLQPGNTSLNMPLAFRLNGHLDITALERSINEIISRHEVLRTTFAVDNDKVVQVIAPEILLKLDLADISHLSDAKQEEAASQLMAAEAHVEFDLGRGPLFKARLLKLATTEHILLLTMHHIVCDGWSNGVLVRELGEIYGAFSQGLASPLPELPIQYADFALWQQEWLEGEDFDEQMNYWKRQLGSELPTLDLPTDFPRNKQRTSYGAIESLLIPRTLTRALKAISQREDVTLFMIFLSAFKVLLHRYSGQQNILIGSPTANRLQSETEELIGAFANTLLLKTDLSGDITFREALHRVKEVSLSAFSNQTLPFEKLVEEIKPGRARNSSQLFQVLFIFQTAFMQPVHLSDLTITPMRSTSPGSIFELSLGVVERAEGVRLQMEYNTDLFEAITISRMLGHLHSILQSVATDIRQKISEIPLLTLPERQLFLVERNRTEESFPADQTISRLFESVAKSSPEKIALVTASERLSYGDLERRAETLAHHLLDRGAEAGDKIAIKLDSLPDFVTAALGVLKTGCVIAPLTSQAAPRFIIGKGRLSNDLITDEITPVNIEAVETGSNSHATFITEQAVPESCAAIVFAEDGTEFLIAHRALVARSTAILKQAQLTAADTVLIPQSFDSCATLEMIFAALFAGADLIACPTGASARDALRSANNKQATVINLPAMVFHRLASEAAGPLPESARVVITGGERASPSAIQKWFGAKTVKPRLLVSYGNAQTGCAAALVEASGDNASLNIDRPSPNAQIYVLDRNRQPVPAGLVGEVYISGDGIASPKVDAAIIPAIGAKALCTGDAARYLKNGEIEIIGRVAVEVMRVEDALLDHPLVLESKVVFKEDHLAAYVAFREGDDLNQLTLHNLVEEKAPGVRLPVIFTKLSSLPLTQDGRVDCAALPETNAKNWSAVEQDVIADDYIEETLKEIWKDVLGVSSAGRRDDFFESGGHSLIAVKFFDQIKKELGVNLPLATMFHATTIEQLARVIRAEKPKDKWESLVTINPNGSKPPLFAVHAAGGNVYFYKDLATRLGPDRPFYGLQAKGLDGTQEVHQRIEDMAAHYIKEIKTVQPEGPYYLGGASFGGLVAYEMAIQLCEMGEPVAQVVLFDTYAPGYPKMLPGHSVLRRKLSQFVLRVEHHIRTLQMLESGERWSYVVRKATKARNLFIRKFRNGKKRIAQRVLKSLGRPLPKALRGTQNAIIVASRSYQPRKYFGAVTLFRADKQPSGIHIDTTLGWSEFAAGRLDIFEVPGTHGTLVVEPRVRLVVEKLERCLESAATAPAMCAGD